MSSSSPPLVSSDLLFTSSGCNRDPNAVDSDSRDGRRSISGGLIAFGSSNLIALYSPHERRIVGNLRGHTKSVTAVKFIHFDRRITQSPAAAASASSTTIHRVLVSGSSADTILVFSFSYDSANGKFQFSSFPLAGHKSAVTALAVLNLPRANQSSTIIASASADQTIRLWQSDDEGKSFEFVHALTSGRDEIVHSLALTSFQADQNSTFLLLAAGGTACKISLFITPFSNSDPLLFRSAVSLDGHSDWLRTLDFCSINPNFSFPDSLLLSSASQDRSVRVWKISLNSLMNSSSLAAVESNQSIAATSLGSRGHLIRFRQFEFLIVLDSVLHGHEDWVLSARWQPPILKFDEAGILIEYSQPLSLLTASADKSMMIWRPSQPIDGGAIVDQQTLEEAEDSVWINEIRVGELGGNTLGFIGAHFGPSGSTILGHGWSGCFHFWGKEENSDQWKPMISITGHSGAVKDLTWDSDFNYLISVGSDQTTRVWAPWNSIKDANRTAGNNRISWHEIARPQIHGFDLNCLSPVFGSLGHQFASGADEKHVRVFLAPIPFLQSLKAISGIEVLEPELSKEVNKKSLNPLVDSHFRVRALRAVLPELGLTNKGLMEGDTMSGLKGFEPADEIIKFADNEEGEVPLDNSPAPIHSWNTLFNEPPTEDQLIQSSLWPEVEKLFGPPFEILCVATPRSGELFAAACVSKSAAHADIRLWETRSWSEIARLPAHKSSVIQMEFNRTIGAARVLLSVSKDRHFTLFNLSLDSTGVGARSTLTILGQTRVKAHARIIWSCNWTADDKYFATGSRDRTAKVWKFSILNNIPQATEAGNIPTFNSAVTAVAWAPNSSSASQIRILAIGLEDGRIQVWSSRESADGLRLVDWCSLLELSDSHGGSVRRLTWRNSTAENSFELASCGEDSSVRLFRVNFPSDLNQLHSQKYLSESAISLK